MLQMNSLHVNYGNIRAIKGVTITVPKGKIVSFLGANGAGKSTILKTISRLVQPKQGEMLLNGRSVLNKSASALVKEGVVHCLEERGIFPEFTVAENLEVGAYTRKDKRIHEDLEMVFNYFPRLRERKGQKGETLSGGEAQMLSIGRSLMAKPKLLLLDEPSLGIAPILVKEIFAMIKQINKTGITIILVEQNANLALDISDYAYVFENGEVSIEGEAKELKSNKKIRESYLGI